MKVSYFSSIIILLIGFIAACAQEPEESDNDVAGRVDSVTLNFNSTNNESSTQPSDITTGSTGPTTAPITTPYTKRTPATNYAWTIIGAVAGGIALIAFVGTAIAMWSCRENSQRRVRVRAKRVTRRKDPPPRVVKL